MGERISRTGGKDESEKRKHWRQDSGLVAGFPFPSLPCSHPLLSLPPSLLSCPTRSSTGLLGALSVPLHSSLTVLPTVRCWRRAETEGAREQRVVRKGEGERRGGKKMPTENTQGRSIIKSWERSVLHFPLPHLHYFSFFPDFLFWASILFFYVLHRNGGKGTEF